MNNKELISILALKMKLSKTEINNMLQTFTQTCIEQLKEDNTVAFQGFGSLEVRKKDERLSVHPVTKIRTLIPPKLVVCFKQSNVLKEKLNSQPGHE